MDLNKLRSLVSNIKTSLYAHMFVFFFTSACFVGRGEYYQDREGNLLFDRRVSSSHSSISGSIFLSAVLLYHSWSC